MIDHLTPDELVSLGRELGEAIRDTHGIIAANTPGMTIEKLTTDGAVDDALDAFCYVAQDGPYTADTLKDALRAAIVAAWVHQPEGA